MSTHEGTPADWYEDPSKVGELRYFDGTQWTEHVTINGVQTTAPLPAPDTEVDPESALSFTMSRGGQRRTEDEQALEVVGPGGLVGRFVTMLDGAPGYRFEAPQGGTVLTVSKPGLKTTVEVADPAAARVGAITKVGRLHSRYDVARADGDATTSVRLLTGATDEWEVQSDGARAATVTRTTASPADAHNLAGVAYSVAITAPLDDQLRRLLLAVPIAIDILDTQAL